MMAQTFIQARQLAKGFRKGPNTITALAGLDLTVDAGSFLALMGPSGSGKTTLLNVLAGIDRADDGSLVIGGTAIDSLSRRQLTNWRARNVGYIFQLYHLVPVLTAFENVELPLLLRREVSRTERRRRVTAALEMVGLNNRYDHYPRQLSGGQEQRVAIARAVVADPPLIVADEPTGDLDGEAAADILELLRSLANQHGKTVIMVTHDPRAAAAADRCLHLEKGRLVDDSMAMITSPPEPISSAHTTSNTTAFEVGQS